MITIRKARKEDSEFIARGFLTAMWISEAEQRKLLPTCIHLAEMYDSLYSWRNAHIALFDGTKAGVLISYDGAIYKEAAAKTFEFIRKEGGEDFTQMTQEAVAGEWYLDTLSVVPKFRRQGIATMLLKYGIELCKHNPTTNTITLYVDPSHDWVVDLYSRIGFKSCGEAFIFGQNYKKMEVVTD